MKDFRLEEFIKIILNLEITKNLIIPKYSDISKNHLVISPIDVTKYVHVIQNARKLPYFEEIKNVQVNQKKLEGQKRRF